MPRCLKCNGSKKYAPMGGISVQCIDCEGVGYISEAKALELNQSAYGKLNGDALFKGAMLVDETSNTPLPIENLELPVEPIDQIASGQKIRNKPGRKKGWNKPANNAL